MKYLCLLALLVSCHPNEEQLPVYKGNTFQYCDVACPSPENTSIAILLVDKHFQEAGFLHPECLESLQIHWLENKSALKGETTQPDIIHIYDINPGEVTGSALIHELIHSSLWCLTKDPDDDHTSPLWETNGPESLETISKTQARDLNL